MEISSRIITYHVVPMWTLSLAPATWNFRHVGPEPDVSVPASQFRKSYKMTPFIFFFFSFWKENYYCKITKCQVGCSLIELSKSLIRLSQFTRCVRFRGHTQTQSEHAEIVVGGAEDPRDATQRDAPPPPRGAVWPPAN